MSGASRRLHQLRPAFLLSIFSAVALLLIYGFMEGRWAFVGFYLVILSLVALFIAPPLWSYTRTSALDETPEADKEELTAD